MYGTPAMSLGCNTPFAAHADSCVEALGDIMFGQHLLCGRTGRALGVTGCALLVAVLTPGCSGESSLVSPEVEQVTADTDDFSGLTEEQRSAETQRSIRILDRFVDAYNARDARMLKLLYHRKYRFRTSETDSDLPETMSRRDVLHSTDTMFHAEDVLGVQLSMEYGRPYLSPEHRWAVVVDAVVDLQVTMPNVFGPPIVYHVDNHPARFVLVPRWRGHFIRWAIAEQQDLYEAPDTERVEVQKTWGAVLHEFLLR